MAQLPNNAVQLAQISASNGVIIELFWLEERIYVAVHRPGVADPQWYSQQTDSIVATLVPHVPIENADIRNLRICSEHGEAFEQCAEEPVGFRQRGWAEFVANGQALQFEVAIH